MALASSFFTSFKESARDSQSYFCQISEGRGNELLCLQSDKSPSNTQPRACLSLESGGKTVTRACQIQSSGKVGQSKKKIANLCAQRKQRVPLPTHVNGSGKPKPLSEFLSQRAGMESMLNTSALQSHEYVGSDTFRCVLPKLEILKFEVAPVVDLLVKANEQECIVEMLSCKFQGSKAVESQNEHFSASMRNQLTWDSSSVSDKTLEVNVQLNVTLEVYTLPFTLLPLSTVETPGNALLQAMVDRMVVIFVDRLLDNYYRWSQMDDASTIAVEGFFCEKTNSRSSRAAWEEKGP